MPCEFCPAVAGTYCGVCGTTTGPSDPSRAQPLTGVVRLGRGWYAVFRGVMRPEPYRTRAQAMLWIESCKAAGRPTFAWTE